MHCSNPLGSRRLICFSLASALVFFGLIGSGCQTAYYETMEKLGYHKRDLMVSDVKRPVTLNRTRRSNSNRPSIASPKP